MKRLPLFRWVGGKRRLIDWLCPQLSAQIGQNQIVSLFYGSGALEMNIGAPDRAQIVADANPELRACYQAIAEDRAAVQQSLEKLYRLSELNDGVYDDLRAIDASALPNPKRAARFLYLQAHCFNGLWRVNQSGVHNAPRDKARKPTPPGPVQWALAEQNARRLTWHETWEAALSAARSDTLIIADPPYRDTFDGYTASKIDFGSLQAGLHDRARLGYSVIAFDSKLDGWEGFAHIELQRKNTVSSGDRSTDKAEYMLYANLNLRPQDAVDLEAL
jgi:DNA adenine methylase